MTEMTTEWRVATFHGYELTPVVASCIDEGYAREVADQERHDYPMARVEVQRRETTPWEVVSRP